MKHLKNATKRDKDFIRESSRVEIFIKVDGAPLTIAIDKNDRSKLVVRTKRSIDIKEPQEFVNYTTSKTSDSIRIHRALAYAEAFSYILKEEAALIHSMKQAGVDSIDFELLHTRMSPPLCDDDTHFKIVNREFKKGFLMGRPMALVLHNGYPKDFCLERLYPDFIVDYAKLSDIPMNCPESLDIVEFYSYNNFLKKLPNINRFGTDHEGLVFTFHKADGESLTFKSFNE